MSADNSAAARDASVAEASGRVAAADGNSGKAAPSEILTPSRSGTRRWCCRRSAARPIGLIHLTMPREHDRMARRAVRSGLIALRLRRSDVLTPSIMRGVPLMAPNSRLVIDLQRQTDAPAPNLRDDRARTRPAKVFRARRSRSRTGLAFGCADQSREAIVIRPIRQHTGRAVVFDSVEDMTPGRNPALDSTRRRLVLRNGRTQGAPACRRRGYLPIPKKLARIGAKACAHFGRAHERTASAPSCCTSPPESAVGPIGAGEERRPDRLDVKKRSIRSAGR